MAGITDSLRIAMSGLKLAQSGLATTSDNVANVNTEGYTRKRVEQQARVVEGRGGGVSQIGIARDVDQFLEQQLRQQQGRLGRSETVNAYAADVQGLVFGDPSEPATGFAATVDDLATKLEAAAAKPEDGALRAALVGAAEDVFNQLGDAAGQVQTLRRDADQRVAALVDEVNAALQAVDDLNREIIRSPADAALLDQRDGLVKQLSRQLDVDTYTHDDGRIAIFAPDGQALLEYEPRVLTFAPSAMMARGAAMNPIEIYTEDELDPVTGDPLPGASGELLVGQGVRAEVPGSPADEIRPTVTGGELGGLLEVRDRMLPELDDQLQQFGRLLRHGLNAAHNGATDAEVPTATLTGSRDLAALAPDHTPVPPPPGTAPTVAGTAYITAYDADAPSNQQTVAIDLADVRDYAATVLGTPADWPDHFAEALAQEINTAFGALGGGAVADGTSGPTFTLAATDSTWGLALADGSGEITQHDAAGNTLTYGLSHFLGLNDVVVTRHGSATDLAVDPTLAANPERIASAKLDVTQPSPGTWEGTLGGVGDSRGLEDLAAALERRVDVVGVGGLADASVTARTYLGEVTSLQALRAAGAERAAERDGILAEELDYQKAGISGVNLDEEMAHLLELQQAYATSARLLTTADQMLQELLNVKR